MLSKQCINVLLVAQTEAERRHSELDLDDILFGIIAEGGTPLSDWLLRNEISLEEVRKRAWQKNHSQQFRDTNRTAESKTESNFLDSLRTLFKEEKLQRWNHRVKGVLEAAFTRALAQNRKIIETNDLLLAVLKRRDSDCVDLLVGLGCEIDVLEKRLQKES